MARNKAKIIKGDGYLDKVMAFLTAVHDRLTYGRGGKLSKIADELGIAQGAGTALRELGYVHGSGMSTAWIAGVVPNRAMAEKVADHLREKSRLNSARARARRDVAETVETMPVAESTGEMVQLRLPIAPAWAEDLGNKLDKLLDMTSRLCAELGIPETPPIDD